MPSLQDQRWDRLESRLDRIEGSLGELREDFAAHKATSVANESKIMDLERSHRKTVWFAVTSVGTVITGVLTAVLIGIL